MDNKNDKKDIKDYGKLSYNDGLLAIDNSNFSFFKDNNSFVFCYKKTARLLKALYIITDNPVFDGATKDELRLLGQEALNSVLIFFTKVSTEGEARLLESHQTFERTVLALFATLDALLGVKVLSPKTVAILVEEYQQILSVLIGHTSHPVTLRTTPELPEDFFTISFKEDSKGRAMKEEGLAFVPSHEASLFYKGQYKTQSAGTMSDIPKKTAARGQLGFKKDSIFDGSFKGHASKNSERTQTIIAEVGKKGSVTIKDVSILLKNVSEKTVQRELIALVSQGVLKKEGERRWSRYSLA